MTHHFEIESLDCEIDKKKILKGFSLAIEPGEVHAIMGPNGAGKSTLASLLAGDESYEVTKGSVHFKGKNLLELDVEERSHLGLFVSFQYPVEVPGVSNLQFLHASDTAHRKSRGEKGLSEKEFTTLLIPLMEKMDIPSSFLKRNLNEGFSGGEKKRNEILQMKLLNPSLAILDETDSGLDIDALRRVAGAINGERRSDNAFLLITHYERLLEYVRPDHVHIMIDGTIVKSGGYPLALELEEKGYDAFIQVRG